MTNSACSHRCSWSFWLFLQYSYSNPEWLQNPNQTAHSKSFMLLALRRLWHCQSQDPSISPHETCSLWTSIALFWRDCHIKRHGGTATALYRLSSGVPQGYVLGPLLFSLHTHCLVSLYLISFSAMLMTHNSFLLSPLDIHVPAWIQTHYGTLLNNVFCFLCCNNSCINTSHPNYKNSWFYPLAGSCISLMKLPEWGTRFCKRHKYNFNAHNVL